jgi:spore maturation protein B
VTGLRLTLELISQWTIPAMILLIIGWAAYKRVPMYDSFITGAKEGFGIAVSIIPYLVAMILVIKVLVASGIFEDMKYVGAIAMRSIGMGEYAESLDLLPLAIFKPLSGSASYAVLLQIFQQHKPDSFLGNTASIMMGSSETTFYVLTVYLGFVQIKKIRHTLAACLLADAAGISAAVIVGYLLFPHS